MILALLTRSISVVLVRKAKKAHFIQLEMVSAGQSTLVFVSLLLLANKFIIHNTCIGDVDECGMRL